MPTGLVSERALRVMGTDAHVVVCGPEALLDHVELLHALEARWSRFVSTSELSQCNTHAGHPVMVSPDTYTCIEHAIDAARFTDGTYDPTVDVTALGYDRTLHTVPPTGPAVTGRPAPGVAGIVLDPTLPSVTLPAGTRLDLGGIGKGFAADLLTDTLLHHGADGVCVNLGGDLRVAGTAPTDDGWIIDIDPTDAPIPHVIALGAGAVATSTTRRRRWERGGRPIHHVLDPRTGEPTASTINTVTVIADTAWRAEALATATLVAGPADAAAIVTRAGATGLMVADTNTVTYFDGMTEFLR
ncbi:MAG: FAD:protein FMN transferase [Acidimicrobiia bacterium]